MSKICNIFKNLSPYFYQIDKKTNEIIKITDETMNDENYELTHDFVNIYDELSSIMIIDLQKQINIDLKQKFFDIDSSYGNTKNYKKFFKKYKTILYALLSIDPFKSDEIIKWNIICANNSDTTAMLYLIKYFYHVDKDEMKKYLEMMCNMIDTSENENYHLLILAGSCMMVTKNIDIEGKTYFSKLLNDDSKKCYYISLNCLNNFKSQFQNYNDETLIRYIINRYYSTYNKARQTEIINDNNFQKLKEMLISDMKNDELLLKTRKNQYSLLDIEKNQNNSQELKNIFKKYENNNDGNNECIICKNHENNMINLQCSNNSNTYNHIYCINCFCQWYKNNKHECCMCRTVFDFNNALLLTNDN